MCSHDVNRPVSKVIIVLAVVSILFTPSFVVPASAQAGTIRFEQVTTEQGLSQSTVHAILQDQQGFMWFATEGGLDSYDGYQFTVYKHDPDNSKTIAADLIQSVYQDRQGELWIGTSVGLDRFDPKTGTFLHYPQDLADPSGLSGQSITPIFQDQSGTLWVGTDRGGLAALDLTKNQLKIYKHSPEDAQSLSSNSVETIYEDRAGELWIGTDAGLDHFDRTSGTFLHPFDHPISGSPAIGNVAILALEEDHQGAMWIGTSNGLFQWNRDRNQLIEYRHNQNISDSLSDNAVTDILEDSQGAIWIGTRVGLDLFDPAHNSFIGYLHNPNDPYSLASDSIRSIYEDRSGVLWIGTSGGLNKYARSTQKFALYHHTPGLANTLSDNNIWSVYEDHPDSLWVGTFSSGLDHLDPESGVVTVYQNNPEAPSSLSSNEIRAIFEDHNGNLWIGMERGGLDRLDPATGTFIHYQHNSADPNSLSDNGVFKIYEDPQGRMWIGTQRGGLNRFDQASGTFVHYQQSASDPLSLSSDDVRAITEDQTGILWIGTIGGGIDLWDGQTNHFKAYRNDPNNPSSLSSDAVLSLFEDSKGTIWVGTFGGGLNRFDRSTQSFTHYTEKDGLPDDTVYGLLADADGNLWLSTNKGLSKFNPGTRTFRNYDVSDGLQGDQFNPGAYFQSQSGEMFFGGTAGLNAFFPQQVKDNPLPPPVVITDFKKFNQTIQTDLASNESIPLSYRDNFISFDFSALDFNAPEKNQYAYMLEGVDKDWVYAGTRRYASYTNLQGGDYTFRVKASNNDGVWSDQATTVHIHITPPFWQTWWFLGLIGVMVISGAVGGYQLRVRDIQARNRWLEQRVAQRTHELAALNDIAAVVNQSLDLTEILNNALEKTLEVTHMDIGLAFRLEEPANGSSAEPSLALLAHRGVSDEYVRIVKSLSLQLSMEEDALQAGKPVVRLNGVHPNVHMSEANEREGIKLAISVPLLVKDKLVGVVTSAAHEARVITTEELSLLSAIGHQVGMAVVNARLYEQAEQRTQELAALNTISEVVNRSLDLTEILNAALDETMAVMGMDMGLAFSFHQPTNGASNESSSSLLAHRGVSDEYANNIAKSLPLQDTMHEEAFLAGQPIVTQVGTHPIRQVREANEREGIQMGINVPLVVQGKLVGGLSLAARRTREITQEELSLLTAIGQQVGMAVVNAQLYEKAEQRTYELERYGKVAESLRGIVNKINSNASVDEVLDFIVAQADVLSDTNFVALWLLQSEQGPFQVHSIRGEFPEALRNLNIGIDEGMLGLAVKERRNVYFQDMTQVQYASGPSGIDEGHPVYMTDSNREILTKVLEAFKAIMVVPLLTQNGTYGALEFFYPTPREFTRQEITLASAFAEQASLAIENAMLREQSAQAAILSERNRLARELHDSVTQLLYSVTLYAEAASELLASGETQVAADHLRELRDTAQEALREMRLLIFELHRPDLEKSGLAAALQARLDAVETRGGIHSSLEVVGTEQRSLPVQAELYNIAHEALNNTLKHARASQVRIRLRYEESGTELEVSDDGVGFDPAPGGLHGGFGISGMKERARKIGGLLQIESAPGRGTKVSVWVPTRTSTPSSHAESGLTGGEMEE